MTRPTDATTTQSPRASWLPALILQREWFWRKAGIVLGGLIAVVLCMTMLTPAPPTGAMVPGMDKLFHTLGFALLVFPLIVTDSRRWFWVVPLAILFGGAIELVQPLVGRRAEWLDFGADVTGVLIGAALAELLHDRIRERMLEARAAQALPAEDTTDEAARLERIRAELMDELRVVLREELAGARPDAPTRHVVPRPPAGEDRRRDLH